MFHSDRFRSVVNEAIDAFNEKPLCKFPPMRQIFGSGVYGLYYNENSSNLLVYVGKSMPSGGRVGRVKNYQSDRLYRRLHEHAKNIAYVDELRDKAFQFRCLTFSDETIELIWAVEIQLIRRNKPLWNTYVHGFGSMNPGKARYSQTKSTWIFCIREDRGRINLRESQSHVMSCFKKFAKELRAMRSLLIKCRCLASPPCFGIDSCHNRKAPPFPRSLLPNL